MRYALIVSVLLLVSCSPRLHQVTGISSQDNVSNAENCEVEFLYLGREGDLLIFDMEVQNTSNEILYIDPDRITISASKNSRSAYAVTPVDPHPLSDYDVGLRLRAKMKSNNMFKVLIGAASAGLQAYSGLGINENMFNGFGRVGQELVTTAGLFAGEVAISSLDTRTENLKEDLHYVPDEILIKNTLRPNQTIRGKVFFDAIPRMNTYTFKVPIESDLFVFHFKK